MRKKSNIHPFLKMAGVKSEKEFYKKFPSDEEFFAAYPQARYGMRIADDGTGMLPIGPLVPLGTTPPAQRTMTTVPVPPMGKYVIPKDADEYDDDEEETPDQETPEQQQAKKQRKKYKLNVNAGDKTWSPFAKDNAWNTGQGVKTTDLFGTTAALASSVLPYQPARMNKPLLPLAIGSYGTGSHAAFEDGGNLPNKSTITGKTKMRNSTVPKDSRYESGFVTVNEYPNKINDTSYSYMSGQPGMEQNMFYNTQIDPATGKPINTLNRNGMIGTIPQDSVNYYKNKISNLAGFKQGGKLSPTKARMMLHDGTLHGKPITDKQRRYFGAVASGYAADGGPMITDVEPSAHTYFRPMTRQGRQVPETPNFIAADGMTMQPVTDADRQAYNNYIHGMRKLPGYDAVDWQHDQTFQKNAAQQLGFDYSKAAAIQADMMARNEMYPGSIKGIQGSDPWGGKPGWIGDRERQKEYVKYQYTAETQNPQSGVMEEYYNSGAPQFTPMTDQQFRSEVERARGNFNTQSNLPPTTNPMDPAYVAPSVPQSGPKAIGLAATGIPTRDEAVANYQARKASGQELPSNYFQEDTKKQKRMKETGDPIGMVRLTGEDVYAYGGPILGGFDARLNQNFPYPMTNQYPHKIGGQYHPYDHTRMEMGGPIPFANGGEAGTDIQVDGNKFKMLSPFTAEIGGQYHSNGGTDIMSNGQQVEAEKKETLHIQPDGTAIVGGNLYVPGTNTKFKDAFKDVAKAEKKTGKVQDKASKFLNEYGSEGIGAKNRYQAPAFNYGVVMSDAYEQKKVNDEAVKNSLTEIQNKMLELGGMIDPENGAKKVSGMFKGKAKWGAKMMAANGAKTPAKPTGPAKQFEWQQGAWYPTEKEKQAADPSWHAPETFRPMIFPQQVPANTKKFPDGTNYEGRAKTQNPAWIRMQEEEGGLSPDSPISKTAITNFPGESGIAKAIAVDKQDKEFIKSLGKDTSKENDKKKVQGLRNKFRITDYIPEIVAGFERAEPYQSMQVQPYLESEYNVSFQNEKNAIQSAFGPAMKAARTAGERATIAAQMAEQLANVDAKEFQFNQQNVGGIRGRNLQEMRGVRDTNLKLGMDAYEKTLAGKEAARQIRQAAGRSVSAKEAARRAKNLELGMYEDYAGWAYNPAVKEKWEMLHPGQVFDPRTVSLADLYEDDEKKTVKKKKKDSKGKESEEETVTTTENKKYYGGPMAYFGEYMPIAPVRTYIAGGAVGGGMGMGMGMGMSHSAPGGMHGLPGQQGSMASRYSPGGDSSYYQKKKRKRKSN